MSSSQINSSQGMTRRRFISTSAQTFAATGALGGGVAGALLSACGESAQTTSGPVEITYTFDAFARLTDAPLVADAMSATQQFKQAGIKVKLNPIDSASFDQKLQLGYAAGQRWDVMFTAPWANNYLQNSLKGNFTPLDDLLPKYAPQLYASMPGAFWDAIRVNGKIYGVPNLNYLAPVLGVFIPQNLAQKYKQYLPSHSELTSLSEMEPYLNAIKTNEPSMTPIMLAGDGNAYAYGNLAWPLNYDVFSAAGSLVGIKRDDSSLRAVNVYETDDYMQQTQFRWKWGQAGYFQKDPIDGTQAPALVQAGKYGMMMGNQAKPNDIPFLETYFGVKLTTFTVGKPLLSTGSILQNMNAIGRSCPVPDKAMSFLNLINTDVQIFNLLCHGIENKHYVFVDKAKRLIDFPKGVTTSTSHYNPSSDWMFGNEQNGYYTDPNAVGIYDHIQEANNSAPRSPAFGFTFDPTNVKTEIAQVGAVQKQVDQALLLGKLDPAKLPGYLSQLKQAGSDTVVAEVQKQLNAWATSKK